MGGEQEQAGPGHQSAEDYLYATPSALQPRAETTSDTLTPAENSRHFYEDTSVFYRAQQWSLKPSAFFTGVLSQGCGPCQVYRTIQALSNKKRKPYRPNRRNSEETLMRTIELRIYSVFFHLLRTRFQGLFHSTGHTDSLAVYLSTHGLGEQANLSAGFSKFNARGNRYYTLVDSTGHHGVLLLSTTFDFEILEKTGDLKQVSAAAIEEIPRIGAMQTYDNAVNKIFGIFEAYLEKWIEGMPQEPGAQGSVQHLIELRAQSLSNQSPPCPNSFDTQLVTAPEISAVPETFPAFTPMSTLALCEDGTMRCFDPSIVVWVPDVSGVMARVTIGALAEGSDVPMLVAPQLSFLPSSAVADEYVYKVLRSGPA